MAPTVLESVKIGNGSVQLLPVPPYCRITEELSHRCTYELGCFADQYDSGIYALYYLGLTKYNPSLEVKSSGQLYARWCILCSAGCATKDVDLESRARDLTLGHGGAAWK